MTFGVGVDLSNHSLLPMREWVNEAGIVEKGEGERGKGRELRDRGHPKVNREEMRVEMIRVVVTASSSRATLGNDHS